MKCAKLQHAGSRLDEECNIREMCKHAQLSFEVRCFPPSCRETGFVGISQTASKRPNATRSFRDTQGCRTLVAWRRTGQACWMLVAWRGTGMLDAGGMEEDRDRGSLHLHCLSVLPVSLPPGCLPD